MRRVVLLGASGSIGTQALDVIEENGDSLSLIGFSVGRQIDKIPVILKRFPSVRYICVRDEGSINDLETRYPGIRFYHGDNGLLSILEDVKPDMVINALVGFVGLFPSLKALDLDAALCLANKETLVTGGHFVKERLSQGHGFLYPIDSEHVAIAKCLKSLCDGEKVKHPFLTASGGAFRNSKREDLSDVAPEMALNHPTWKMGARITVDCATMMNKGFELIEAKELFGFDIDDIKIVMHDESQVHSGLLLDDGSVIAELCPPDMHGPIRYALSEGKRLDNIVRAPSLDDFKGLHFREFDEKRYPAVSLAKRAAKMPLGATTALNAADETAVSLFLSKHLPFLRIEDAVEKTLDEFRFAVREERDLIAIDSWARERALEIARTL